MSWLDVELSAWVFTGRLHQPTLPFSCSCSFLVLSGCLRVELPELKAPLSLLNSVDFLKSHSKPIEKLMSDC